MNKLNDNSYDEKKEIYQFQKAKEGDGVQGMSYGSINLTKMENTSVRIVFLHDVQMKTLVDR